MPHRLRAPVRPARPALRISIATALWPTTDAAPEHELGVHALGAVALIRGRVYLADQIGEPGMAHASS